jgi:hypothetical protein
MPGNAILSASNHAQERRPETKDEVQHNENINSRGPRHTYGHGPFQRRHFLG